MKLSNWFHWIHSSINTTNLAGSIDVVVIKHQDGTLRASPFYVRFGKLDVLNSGGKDVYIHVNGTLADLHMILSDEGQAYFHEREEENSGVDKVNENVVIKFNNETVSEADRIPIKTGTYPVIHNDVCTYDNLDNRQFENKSTVKRTHIQRIRNFTGKSSKHRIRRRSSSYDSNCLSEDDRTISLATGNSKQTKREIQRINLSDKISHNLLEQNQEIVFKPNHIVPFATSDDTLARCQSDSDLDKRGVDSNEATFFLTSGRKAISEILFQYENEEDRKYLSDKDNREDLLSTDSSRSFSCIDHLTTGNSGQIYFDEPFVFSINSVSQAMFYLKHLKSELDELYLINEAKTARLTNHETGEYNFSTDGFALSTSIANDMVNMQKFKQSEQPSSKKGSMHGMYLQEAIDNTDPEITSLYMSRTCQSVEYKQEGLEEKTDSLPSRSDILNDINLILGDVGISDCGGLATQELTSELFEKSLITKEEFIKNPDVIHSPNLVVRINNRYYNWKTAAPMIIAASLFQYRLSKESIDKLIDQHMPTKSIMEKPLTSPRGWWIFGGGWNYISHQNKTSSLNANETVITATIEDVQITNTIVPTSIESTVQNIKKHRILLTSEELQSLNLKYGENEVTFSVTTALQGTSVVTASVFLYNETDKFIVSDIDGTITRSDVIGQILPLVGRDWSHDGIAEFFCAIADNGYNFIYVSSRSIGQSAITKGYLSRLHQRGFELPRGPALLSPDSLFNALYREVVTKKPEEFKIDCLKTILALFPDNRCPFYAGFGNRVNDQWAYTSVGIPLQRIFTINPSGVVKHHASDYSSYNTLHEIVDQLFPPIFKGGTSLHGPQEYSTFTYWRNEI